MNIDHSRVSFLTVTAAEAGQRLDNYLLSRLKGLPKSRLYRLLRKGEIRVNKGRIAPSYRILEGDAIRLPPIRLESPKAVVAPSQSLIALLEQSVLFEDDNMLVVDKPAGLAVHGGSGLSIGLIEALRQMRAEHDYLELVHRLDRDTSGCLLIAKNRSTLKQLHQLFRDRQVDKIYQALVAGRWPPGLTEVNAPLKKNVLQSGERMVSTSAEGKRSVTGFSLLKRIEGAKLESISQGSNPNARIAEGEFSQIEARPVTGRTHQIRVHARSAGYPLCGDTKYGIDDVNKQLRTLGYKRLFLHAHTLSFEFKGRQHVFEAALPEDWQQLVDA